MRIALPVRKFGSGRGPFGGPGAGRTTAGLELARREAVLSIGTDLLSSL
jgi:hypothetical protein